MEERRRSGRTALNLPVELLRKQTNQQIELLRAGINEGGIGGYTRDTIETGDEVSIRITFPQRGEEATSEVISGKVVWARRDGNFIAFGISFSQSDSDAHPHLDAYLQYAAQFE